MQVVGRQFDPLESVSIKLDGQLVAFVEASSLGFFVVTFMVPDVPPGDYQVAVGNTLSLPFVVTPTIHACFKNHKTDAEKQGELRIVNDPANCRQNETPISWNQP